jgi:hypothetical protein
MNGDHQKIKIVLLVTTKRADCKAEKSSLLFKHNDDARQELFAIEFVMSSGMDKDMECMISWMLIPTFIAPAIHIPSCGHNHGSTSIVSSGGKR